MKIEVLKEYIQKVVREEIKNTLKDQLRTHLSEILLGNSKNSKNELNLETVVKEKSQSLSRLLVDNDEEEVIKKPEKKFVKYTNNPLLNSVMNEITSTLPQEGSMVGYGEEIGGSGSEQLNEVVVANNPIKIPDDAPTEVKKVASAITRDYRSLMKAVDKKRGIVK